MDYGFNGEYMDFSFLKDSCGKQIQVERGGPDKLEGILRHVQGDYMAVQTKDGLLYLNCNHIKSITEALVSGSGGEEWEAVECIQADNFYDLMESLNHRLVKINHGGPNALQGVLIECRPEAVTIVHQMKEYVHFPTYHIKSISVVTENKNDKDKNKDEKNENKNEGKEERREERREDRRDDRRDERRDERREFKRSTGGSRAYRSARYSNSRPIRFS